MNKVQKYAHAWEEFANIKFKFVTTHDAEIRISFATSGGSWSAVGNDALVEQYFPRFQPTMNFSWLEDGTDDVECRRVVLHEFGHALGAVHEHSQPTSPMKWNKPKVYQIYSGPPNYWSKADVDHNIFIRYSKSETNYIKFDPASIMLYQFDRMLLLNGRGTRRSTDLSEQDKRFIAEMYPKDSSLKSGKTATSKRLA